MNSTRQALVGAATILAFAFPQTSKAIDVFLDWDGSLSTMAAAWSDAGYTAGEALTAAEISGIMAMAKGKIETKFGGFTVAFHESTPSGLYEWVKLGATTASTTTYGSSSGIDWRNRVKDGGAEIYLANFGVILSKTTFTRAENIARLTAAIANTTAHELGHCLGHQHYDAYGIPSVTCPAYPFAGEQNGSISATGVTGLTAADRGHDRFFNPMELLKLEYADGVASTLGTSISEAVGPKDTLATAQAVFGTPLPISGMTAVNIEGFADFGGQMDIFKFVAGAGSKLSANTFSHGHYSPFTETMITLMDSTGAPMLMVDDIDFFLDDFMTGTSTYYSDDSLFFNFVAPYSGTYFLKVTGMIPGKYDLLLSGISTVPEPLSMTALGLGLAAVALRRRRKSPAA